MQCITVLAVIIAAVAAAPQGSQRIVGGALTTINQYPCTASLLYARTGTNHRQSCGGTILTRNAILSAAHCVFGDLASQWRARVGSSWANSGGTVHNIQSLVVNTAYSSRTLDSDVAILKTSTAISYGSTVQACSIAGANYNLADNQAVYAVGWGTTSFTGSASEQIRHVQVWSVNQNTCATRYRELNRNITANMLCSGWLDVGGRDQCQGDSGGPLFHNGVVVGICSWGEQCALARYPGVNTRVSRFTNWITNNA